MSFARGILYRIIRWPILWIMSLYHWPKFIGRENMPEGGCIICANHSGLADPVWAVLAMKPKTTPWIMAKKSAMEAPVIGKLFAAFGAFGVDRDNPDINAVKKSLTVLKNGEQLLIFPEGTRVKKGKTVEPKSGAVMLANRTDVPIVPVFITRNRKPFRRIRVVIGTPYKAAFESRKPSSEELQTATDELMRKIYAMESTK